MIDKATAHLECISGYVPTNRSLARCSKMTWSPPLTTMTCSRGMIMVTGGKAGKDGTFYYLDKVEAFLPATGSFRAPKLPYTLSMHSLGYVDGKVIGCGGGNDSHNSTDCLQIDAPGEY